MKTLEEFAQAAFAALGEERNADAVGILEAAVKAFPERPKIHYYLGVARARLGEHQEAKAAFERALALFRDARDEAWANTMVQLGCLLHDMRETAAALDCFEGVLAHDPGHRDALYNAGSICQSRGHWAAARSYYLRCLTHSPDDGEVRYHIAATWLEEGRPSEALPIFEALAKSSPTDGHLQEAFEHCLRRLGREEEAERHRLYRMKLAVP